MKRKTRAWALVISMMMVLGFVPTGLWSVLDLGVHAEMIKFRESNGVDTEAGLLTPQDYDKIPTIEVSLVSATKTFEISTIEQWNALARYSYALPGYERPTNSVPFDYDGYTLKLTADLYFPNDAIAEGRVYALNDLFVFKTLKNATFDGNGHTITFEDEVQMSRRLTEKTGWFRDYSTSFSVGNLKIEGYERYQPWLYDRRGIGLFCETAGSVTIKNLNVKLEGDLYAWKPSEDAANIYSNNSYGREAGVLVGNVSNDASLNIENCNVISAEKGKGTFHHYPNDLGSNWSHCGGLVGNYNTGGNDTISNCYVDINITESANQTSNGMETGGLVGYGNSTLSISDCAVFDSRIEVNRKTSDVKANNLSVGPIVGCLSGGSKVERTLSHQVTLLRKHNGSIASYGRSGRVVGRYGSFSTTTMINNYYGMVDNSDNTITENSGTAGLSTDPAALSNLGTYWTNTEAGVPNLKSVVLAGPTSVVLGTDAATAVRTPTLKVTPTKPEHAGEQLSDLNWVWTAENLYQSGRLPVPKAITFNEGKGASIVNEDPLPPLTVYLGPSSSSQKEMNSEATAPTLYPGGKYTWVVGKISGENLSKEDNPIKFEYKESSAPEWTDFTDRFSIKDASKNEGLFDIPSDWKAGTYLVRYSVSNIGSSSSKITRYSDPYFFKVEKERIEIRKPPAGSGFSEVSGAVKLKAGESYDFGYSVTRADLSTYRVEWSVNTTDVSIDKNDGRLTVPASVSSATNVTITVVLKKEKDGNEIARNDLIVRVEPLEAAIATNIAATQPTSPADKVEAVVQDTDQSEETAPIVNLTALRGKVYTLSISKGSLTGLDETGSWTHTWYKGAVADNVIVSTDVPDKCPVTLANGEEPAVFTCVAEHTTSGIYYAKFKLTPMPVVETAADELEAVEYQSVQLTVTLPGGVDKTEDDVKWDRGASSTYEAVTEADALQTGLKGTFSAPSPAGTYYYFATVTGNDGNLYRVKFPVKVSALQAGANTDDVTTTMIGGNSEGSAGWFTYDSSSSGNSYKMVITKPDGVTTPYVLQYEDTWTNPGIPDWKDFPTNGIIEFTEEKWNVAKSLGNL